MLLPSNYFSMYCLDALFVGFIILKIIASGQVVLKLSGSSDFAIINSSYTFSCSEASATDVVYFKRNGQEFGRMTYSNGQCNTIKTNKTVNCQPELCSCHGDGVYNWTVRSMTDDWHLSNIMCYSIFGATSNTIRAFIAVPFSSVGIFPNKSVDMEIGSSVHFSCCTRPASRPAANISWFTVDGDTTSQVTENVSQIFNIIKGDLSETTSILEYYPTIPHHEMRVYCVASADDLESVSSAGIEIDVKYQPSGTLMITSEPDGPLYVNGSTATLTCKLKGGNPIANLSWTCPYDNKTLHTNDVSATKEAVLLLYLALLSTGEPMSCNCTATHYVGSFIRTDEIIFDFFVAPEKPDISTTPDKAAYIEGDMLTLICKVKGGKPLAFLSWKCKGTVMESQTTINNNTVESTLVVKMDRSYNTKKCVCLANHPLPSYHEETSVNFTVYYTTNENLKITTIPMNVENGSNVSVICSLRGGNPLADVQLTCGSIHGDRAVKDGSASSTLFITSIKKNSIETTCWCQATHRNFSTFSKYERFSIPVSDRDAKIDESPDDTSRIVGITAAVTAVCLLVILAVIVGIVCLWKRRRVPKKNKKENYESPRIPNLSEDGYSNPKNEPRVYVKDKEKKQGFRSETEEIISDDSLKHYSSVRTSSTVRREVQAAMQENKSSAEQDTEQRRPQIPGDSRGSPEQRERASIARKVTKSLDEALEQTKDPKEFNLYEEIEMSKPNERTNEAIQQQEHNQGYLTMDTSTKEAKTTDERFDFLSNSESNPSMANDDGYIKVTETGKAANQIYQNAETDETTNQMYQNETTLNGNDMYQNNPTPDTKL